MTKQRYKIDRQLRREVKAMPCVNCGSRYRVDPAHIRTFGSSGIEDCRNMMPLCRTCHEDQHRLGLRRFCDESPRVAALLKELGWVFLECNGQFKLHNEKYPELNN